MRPRLLPALAVALVALVGLGRWACDATPVFAPRTAFAGAGSLGTPAYAVTALSSGTVNGTLFVVTGSALSAQVDWCVLKSARRVWASGGAASGGCAGGSHPVPVRAAVTVP